MTSEVLEQKLERIEHMLAVLLDRQTVREWYTTREAARLLGKAEYTVRQWCRTGRVNAAKKVSGRGAHASWTLSHSEVLRIQRDGLLPFRQR
jgi:hypothetical protein